MRLRLLSPNRNREGGKPKFYGIRLFICIDDSTHAGVHIRSNSIVSSLWQYNNNNANQKSSRQLEECQQRPHNVHDR